MDRKILVFMVMIPALLIMAGTSIAGVNVNLNIGPPPVYRFAEPPELVVIPNTYVYFAPGIDMDIVFYNGHWYRSHNGHWFRAVGYNGPWNYVVRERVPRYIINLPPNFRITYGNYPRIPHHHVHDNWRRWEREKYWEKRQWKHEQNEWKRDQRQEHREQRRDARQERREDRRDHRQDMREQRQEHRKEMREDRQDRRQDRRDERKTKRTERKDKRDGEK